MDEYQSLIGLVSMTMGVAWASGINLYATLLVLGLSGATGNVDLPPVTRPRLVPDSLLTRHLNLLLTGDYQLPKT